jgi:glycosyltransferase involved in cell wall biosynthesis
VDCAAIDALPRPPADDRPVTILWNHRWEHDKEPEVFLRAVSILAAEGLAFRVHLVGERFRRVPPALAAAREMLGDRLATFGFVDDRQAYLALLRESDVAVSTARQEFYGIALLEAAYAGAYPLAPDRLVYPELYPPEHLYADEEDLTGRLRRLVTGGVPSGWDAGFRESLREGHDLSRTAARLDDLLEACAHGG